MSWGLKLVTAATEEPVTLQDVREFLKVEVTDDDTLIISLIKTARRHAETFTRRAFITQTWKLTLDKFPASDVPLLIPRAPLQSVSSVKYIDTDGVTQTLATSKYIVDIENTPGRISPAFGEVWPDTRSRIGAVTIEFVAGYGNPSTVPEGLKTAIRLLVAHWYETRMPVVAGKTPSEVPFSIEALLWEERVWQAA